MTAHTWTIGTALTLGLRSSVIVSEALFEAGDVIRIVLGTLVNRTVGFSWDKRVKNDVVIGETLFATEFGGVRCLFKLSSVWTSRANATNKNFSCFEKQKWISLFYQLTTNCIGCHWPFSSSKIQNKSRKQATIKREIVFYDGLIIRALDEFDESRSLSKDSVA